MDSDHQSNEVLSANICTQVAEALRVSRELKLRKAQPCQWSVPSRRRASRPTVQPETPKLWRDALLRGFDPRSTLPRTVSRTHSFSHALIISLFRSLRRATFQFVSVTRKSLLNFLKSNHHGSGPGLLQEKLAFQSLLSGLSSDPRFFGSLHRGVVGSPNLTRCKLKPVEEDGECHQAVSASAPGRSCRRCRRRRAGSWHLRPTSLEGQTLWWTVALPIHMEPGCPI